MNKEIKLKSFIIAILLLTVLEIFLLVMLNPKKSNNYNAEYCIEAICNSDNSMCYAYDLDQDGNTVIVWKGSCQSGN